jgi:hypothetical protein
MPSEFALTLWSGGLGVVLGSIITVVASYLQQRWAYKRRAQERRDLIRYELARNLMRYRLDFQKLLAPLNEIPLVFGDDEEALRLYRAVLQGVAGEQRNNDFADLIQHIARAAGLDAKVTSADVRGGFVSRDQGGAE